MTDDDFDFPDLPPIPKLPSLERITEVAQGSYIWPKSPAEEKPKEKQKSRPAHYCMIKEEHARDNGEIQIFNGRVICPYFALQIHNNKEFQYNVCKLKYDPIVHVGIFDQFKTDYYLYESCPFHRG